MRFLAALLLASTAWAGASRSFDDASFHLMLNATSPVSSLPATCACWMDPDTTAADGGVLSMGNNGDSTELTMLMDDVLARFSCRQVGASTSGVAVKTWSGAQWRHFACVFNSNSSRTAYVDGVAGSEETTDTGATTFSTGIYVGADIVSTVYVDGEIAHCAVWDVALTADEIMTLALGRSPARVRPNNLQGYWPLWGNQDPEPDMSGNGLNLTGAATPSESDSGPPVSLGHGVVSD